MDNQVMTRTSSESTTPGTTSLPPRLTATAAGLAGERLTDADEDVHFSEAVAAVVIERLSRPGALVLDPFAGMGTTLAVAERLDRRAIGVELLPERVALSRERAPRSRVIEGDARGLHQLVTGPVDLCLTSPPYMTANEHPYNPLTAYERLEGDYPGYLREMTTIAERVHALLRPGGHLVVNAANIRYAGHTTTLAWDLARAMGTAIPFVGESVICWDTLPHDFTGDYLLHFQRPA